MTGYTSMWLSSQLKEKIKKVFEPRYKRTLTDDELFEIAENLSVVIEELVKLKWRQKYEYAVSKS